MTEENGKSQQGSPSKVSSRRLSNWLEGFVHFTSVIGSPEIFRLWAGIGLLGAALERRVWARTKGSSLYPNLYIVLVGPPGVGKSAVISQSERLIRAVPDLFVAPSSVTTASVIDSLAGAQRKIIRPNANPSFVQFNSLQVIASELGVFLPAYDTSFMNVLQKIYDGELYEERRRTGKVNHLKIDYPQISLLAGTTPSYLNTFLPEGAWDQGFTSRTIFIFSGEVVQTPLFSEEEEFTSLETTYNSLVADLKTISNLYGKVSWTQEAMNAISAWADKGCPPQPEHGKLQHYNSRRLAHCIKLCVVASVARSDDLVIDLVDYQTALSWLLAAEEMMPDIFKSMGVSQDARVMEDTWYFIFTAYKKEQKPILEHRVVSFISQRVASYQVTRMIEVMVKAGMLKPEYVGALPAYVPLKKTI